MATDGLEDDRICFDPERCRAGRGKRGWNQRRLAEVAGIGIATVKRLEAGRRVKSSSARAYAVALEIPMDSLLLRGSPGALQEDDAPSDRLPFASRIRLDRERCLEARRNKGWSREHLSALAAGENSISVATIKRLEAGKAVQLESARCYSATLGVSVRSLISEELAPRRVPPSRATARLIGRSDELSRLLRSLRQVMAGETHVTVTHGPAGIGKTSLLERLCDQLSRRRAHICLGQGYEIGELPFQALVEALYELPLDVPGLADDDRNAILDWLDPRPEASRDRASEYALFRSLWRWLIAVSREQPIVLIVDDLQWLDPGALRLLEQLCLWANRASTTDGPRLLIVIGSRPPTPNNAAAATLARLLRISAIDEMALAGLDESGTRELLVRCDVSWPSNQLVGIILEATEGNPGFVRGAIDFLQRHDLLVKRGGATNTRATAGVIEFPPDLTAVFLEQCRGLGAECVEALIPAAFLGARFQVQLLAELLERNEDDLRGLLAEPVRAGLLLNHRQTFSFSHPLVRHVLYHEPIPAERERIHLRVARLLAATSETRAVEVAEHMLRADSLVSDQEFVAQLRIAAELSGAALQQGARFVSAAAHRARESGDFAIEASAVLDEKAAVMLHDAWDLGPALEHYEHALAAYSELDDRAGRARMLDKQSRALALNGGQVLPPGVLIQALEDLGDSEPAVRASLLCTLADTILPIDPAAGEVHAREALELAERCGNDATAARVMNSLAFSHYSKVELHAALANWENGRRIAARTDDTSLECQYLERLPLAHYALADTPALEHSLAEAREIGESIDDPGGQAIVACVEGQWSTLRGDLDGSLETTERGVELLSRSRFFQAMTIAFPLLASTRCHRGDFVGGRAALEGIKALLDPPELVLHLFKAYAALISAWEGTASGSELDGFRLTHPFAPESLNLVELILACIAVEFAALRDEDVPDARSVEVLAEADRRGLVFASSWPLLVPRLLAVAAGRNGRNQEAGQAFERALKVAEQSGAWLALARTRLDYSRFLDGSHEACDPTAAFRQRELAIEAFTSFELEGWVARARR